MTEAVVNAVVAEADVDMAKAALLLALRGPDGAIRKLSIRMQEDPDARLARVLGVQYMTQAVGRAVRLKEDGDRVLDVANIVDDIWLVDAPQEEAPRDGSPLSLESDTRTEP